MNASQAFEILQKEYPIFRYPMEIILGLIILAFIIIVLKKLPRNREKIFMDI